MAKAVITLEDTGEGNFQARIEYEDGFQPFSTAQQHGFMLMHKLSQMADRVGDEEVIGNAPSSIAQQEPDQAG